MKTSSSDAMPDTTLKELGIKYPYLSTKALRVVEGTMAERIHFLKSDHWVGYPIADEALSEMFDLLDGPRVSRMEGMLIVSTAFNGKTTLLRRFRDKTRIEPEHDGSIHKLSTLLVNAPSVADEKRFLQSILNGLHSPYSSLGSTGALESVAKEYFRKLNLKILMIDECQNLISGDTRQHEVCINLFKSLMNDLQISIIAAGVPSALNALQFDPQLETRFRVLVLPRWLPDLEFDRLVLSIEKLLPLQDVSQLDDKPDLVARLYELCEGRIGELFRLMRLMTIHALRQGKEIVDEASLEAVSMLAPSNRKALLNEKF